MEFKDRGTDCFRKPFGFGQSNAMFPCNGTFMGKHPLEKAVDAGIRLFFLFGFFVVFHHDIGVDVAVAGVAETSYLHTGFPLKALAEFDQFDEAGTRDDNVFIEFRHSGSFQTVREFPAQLPDVFNGFFRNGLVDFDGAEIVDELPDFTEFLFESGLPSVDFYNKMSPGCGGQGVGTEVLSCGVEGEAVRNFQSGWQVTGIENILDGSCGRL